MSLNLGRGKFVVFSRRHSLHSHGASLHPGTEYYRGHGFESRSGLNFFQALVSLLLKLCA